MNPFHYVIVIALLVDLGYGLMVFATNPKRRTNIVFFALSLALAGWLSCVVMAMNSTLAVTAEFWIRQAFIVCALAPTICDLLRASISYPEERFLRNLWRCRWLVACNVAIAVMCQTDFFLTGISLPTENAGFDVAEPEYGVGFPLFSIYFVTAMGYLTHAFIRDIRREKGLRQTELQFILLGCGAGLLTGAMLALIVPAILGTSQTAPLASVSVIILDATMAYGIATRRIMGVAVILRRATAYALLLIYLALLYAGIAGAALGVFHVLDRTPGHWPHILATLAVAISGVPARGRMQHFAGLLFIHAAPIDVGDLLQRAGRVLQKITTLDDLLAHFTAIVTESMGTNRVTVMLADNRGFREVRPRSTDRPPRALQADSALVRALRLHNRPLVAETLQRQRLSPLLGEAVNALSEMHESVAVGIQSKGSLTGLMLLGPKLSGHMYSALEEDALEALGNELGVAVENAKLFTETRNSRIYNDILLDNLGSGVIAADQNHRITTANRDAHRVLRMPHNHMIGRPISVLPQSLAAFTRETFASGGRRQEEELSIRLAGHDPIFLRTGGSVFHGHTGETLGALIVFHDVTHLKALQKQIRRSDRLASMGTLSAGMAHEIKNPLVSIKTFTQLLPERYEDAEFRETFSQLVGDEVTRIDGIVNQLLSFARPSKPSFAAVAMHDILNDSLRLVSEECLMRSVRIRTDFACSNDTVLADANLLNQAFVNFFLNAKDAMEKGGTLHVSTSLLQNARVRREHRDPRVGNSAILIRIEDDGSGIQEENLMRIFDPFFTTKSNGTGLGLAVAHGIIVEQGGVIDVQSQVGRGTAFTINFPLPKKEAVL